MYWYHVTCHKVIKNYFPDFPDKPLSTLIYNTLHIAEFIEYGVHCQLSFGVLLRFFLLLEKGLNESETLPTLIELDQLMKSMLMISFKLYLDHHVNLAFKWICLEKNHPRTTMDYYQIKKLENQLIKHAELFNKNIQITLTDLKTPEVYINETRNYQFLFLKLNDLFTYLSLLQRVYSHDPQLQEYLLYRDYVKTIIEDFKIKTHTQSAFFDSEVKKIKTDLLFLSKIEYAWIEKLSNSNDIKMPLDELERCYQTYFKIECSLENWMRNILIAEQPNTTLQMDFKIGAIFKLTDMYERMEVDTMQDAFLEISKIVDEIVFRLMDPELLKIPAYLDVYQAIKKMDSQTQLQLEMLSNYIEKLPEDKKWEGRIFLFEMRTALKLHTMFNQHCSQPEPKTKPQITPTKSVLETFEANADVTDTYLFSPRSSPY